ncbi:MAG: GNAT family N-acetyltransferase [Acutalibacter sp.]|jgi:Cof subfamily protein (haloacid dehalogenase superfamily)
MNETLYVSDLDGTLLTPEERLSPFTVRVLNALVEQGVHFTYATARSRHSAEVVTAGLTKNLPVIVYNGAFVIDGATGEKLVESGFSPEQIAQVRAWGETCGLRPLCYAFVEGVERVSWREDRVNEGIAFYLSNRKGDSRLRPVGEDNALYRGEVFYFTYIGEQEELEPLWRLARECSWLNVTYQQELYRQEYWLELMPRAATKANASRRLLERLGCSRMVSFGDAINDVSLLQAADWGCAVENAVPQLLAQADEILPGNRSDGVAKFLLADTAPALALGKRAGAFRLRLYRPSDLEELIQLFYETVHTVNLGDYSQREVDAWVPSPESVNRETWGQTLAAHYTVVAEQNGVLLGFGDLDHTGYLDRLYVHKDFQSRGVATAIVQALEGCARGLEAQRVTVHASRTARPFFEARGYRVEYAQQVERYGVLLENFAMELPLEKPQNSDQGR